MLQALAVVGLTMLAALHWAELNPNPDEGSVCVMAAGLVDGEALYAERWNEKGPLQYVVAASWFHATEVSLFSLRMLAGVTLSVTLLLAAALTGSVGWWVAAGLLVLAPWFEAHHALAEGSLAALSLLATALVLRPDRGSLVMAGGLAAASLFFKQSFLVLFPALWLVAAAESRRLFSVAFIVTVALGCFSLLAHAREAAFSIPPFGNSGELFTFDVDVTAGNALMVLPVALIVAVFLLARQRKADHITYAFALVSLWLTVPMLLRPGLFRLWPAIVVAIVAGARLVRASARTRQVALVFAGGVLALALSREVITQSDLGDVRAVASRVEELVPPGQRIWAGPHDSLVYCLSQRWPADRYSFALPWAPGLAEREHLLDRLSASPPPMLIDAGPALGAWQPAIETSLPGFNALLQRDYRLVDTIAGRRLYLRNE